MNVPEQRHHDSDKVEKCGTGLNSHETLLAFATELKRPAKSLVFYDFCFADWRKPLMGVFYKTSTYFEELLYRFLR